MNLEGSLDSDDDLTLARDNSPLPMSKVGKSSAHPLTVNIEVNRKKITMEIDTGAAVSVISSNTSKKLFNKVKLSKSTLRLRTCIGEPMPVMGEWKLR